MPSIGKVRTTTPGHPVTLVHLAVAAASRMAVVQAVDTGATVVVVGEAAREAEAKAEVLVRSQKRTNTGAAIWP
jgi:hypothetical protein